MISLRYIDILLDISCDAEAQVRLERVNHAFRDSLPIPPLQ